MMIRWFWRYRGIREPLGCAFPISTLAQIERRFAAITNDVTYKNGCGTNWQSHNKVRVAQESEHDINHRPRNVSLRDGIYIVNGRAWIPDRSHDHHMRILLLSHWMPRRASQRSASYGTPSWKTVRSSSGSVHLVKFQRLEHKFRAPSRPQSTDPHQTRCCTFTSCTWALVPRDSNTCWRKNFRLTAGWSYERVPSLKNGLSLSLRGYAPPLRCARGKVTNGHSSKMKWCATSLYSNAPRTVLPSHSRRGKLLSRVSVTRGASHDPRFSFTEQNWITIRARCNRSRPDFPEGGTRQVPWYSGRQNISNTIWRDD